MPEIDADTQLCAVIGNPVGHSLSPAMHNAAFAARQLNTVYLAFEVADLPAFFTGMRAMPSFRGLSITIPHKVEALRLVDTADPLAQMVGCINTVTREGGKLHGSITDGLGTLRAFRDAGVNLAGKRVLFLGAGGAVRAVAFAMATEAQAAAVTVLARNPARAAELVRDLRTSAACETFCGDLQGGIEAAMRSHDVIVQGTPLGMHPHNEDHTPVDAALLEPRHVVFDMVYRPLKTRLLREAAAAGCKTIPGYEMLVNQAELQFEAWTGTDAPREVMRAALLSHL